MSVDVAAIRQAVERIDTALATEAPRLTELDGKLGDGDLGITLTKAFAALRKASPAFSDELGKAFSQAASEVSKVSSSSFGTLLATALMAAGKTLGARTSFEWSETAGLLDAAMDKMMERGKAALGDKTVLDAMDAARTALRSASDGAAARASVGEAVARAVEEFAGKPNRVGRARIFGDATVGVEDPGMAAFKVMAGAI